MMHVDEQGTAQRISKTNKKWKEEIKHCPACYQIGVQTQLKLYQINMFEAVYLCPNYLNCLYPQADGWYFVNRSIDEMISDVESDQDEEHNKPDIHDEVENLITKMQSEFSNTNSDNIVLNSIISPPRNKMETSLSMLFSEMDNRLKHIEEKVVENINENNRILMETEDKSNYIDNDLLEDLDNFLNECNSIQASIPNESEVSNTSKCNISETMLPLNNTKNVNNLIQASLLNESEVSNASKRITIVSETLLPPNNIELPNDTQNVSTQCFTVECTPHNQISLKMITSSPNEAGDSLQKNLIKTVLIQDMDTTKSETLLASKKNVRRSLRKAKNELPTKLKNYEIELKTKSSTNLNYEKRNERKTSYQMNVLPPTWKKLTDKEIKNEEFSHLHVIKNILQSSNVENI